MGLTALNQQRHKYNFIPHASCNSCNYRNEYPVHYFLECPTYQLARTNLLRSIDPILTYIFQNIHDLVNRRSKERLIQIMLNADQRLENQQNLRIFWKCLLLCLSNRTHEMALIKSGGWDTDKQNLIWDKCYVVWMRMNERRLPSAQKACKILYK